MSLLIRALNVKPCGCSDCELAQKIQKSSSHHNGLQIGDEVFF